MCVWGGGASSSTTTNVWRPVRKTEMLILGLKALLGSLGNHNGNAKENVTLKMTSKYFKLLRDSFNSFNLFNVAEQSGS